MDKSYHSHLLCLWWRQSLYRIHLPSQPSTRGPPLRMLGCMTYVGSRHLCFRPLHVLAVLRRHWSSDGLIYGETSSGDLKTKLDTDFQDQIGFATLVLNSKSCQVVIKNHRCGEYWHENETPNSLLLLIQVAIFHLPLWNQSMIFHNNSYHTYANANKC